MKNKELDKNPLERIENKIEKILWLFPTSKKEATREIMISIQQIIKGIPSDRYKRPIPDTDEIRRCSTPHGNDFEYGFNSAMDLVEKYKDKIIGGKNETSF